jgi:hypothetical protein
MPAPNGLTLGGPRGAVVSTQKKVVASWNQPDGQTLRRRLEVSLSCRVSGSASLWRPENRSAANAGGCNDPIPE